MSECVLEEMRLGNPRMKLLVEKFVADELCPCAQQKFSDMNHQSDFNATKEALWQAVVNEMVLRALATAAAKEAA